MVSLNKKKSHLLSQSGFSLIELMIAIPLGLLVIVAVMEVFTGNLQSVFLQNSYARVQENGRIATELMIKDIRGADYRGCVRDIGLVVNHLDQTDVDYNTDAKRSLLPTMTAGVDGNDNMLAGQTIGGISVIAGTDTLTLEGANSMQGIRVVSTMLSTSSDIAVTPGVMVNEGELILMSDCQRGDLFSNTNNDTSANASLSHTTTTMAQAGAINNVTGSFSDNYTVGAQILRAYKKVYFIGLNASGGPSLYRSHNADVQELVRDVIDLQLMYGIDTNNNLSVNEFTSLPGDMSNVLSIRVALTVDNGNSSSGDVLIKNYEVTANIRNRTLPRN